MGERGRSSQALGRSHFSTVKWEEQLHFRVSDVEVNSPNVLIAGPQSRPEVSGF